MWGYWKESVMCGDLGRNQLCVGSREESVMWKDFASNKSY